MLKQIDFVLKNKNVEYNRMGKKLAIIVVVVVVKIGEITLKSFIVCVCVCKHENWRLHFIRSATLKTKKKETKHS